MLRYYYINREWMLSARARFVYRICAFLSLALFLMLIVLHLPFEIPLNLVPAARLLLLAGAVGAATTTVGMEYFLFGFDNSSAWKKASWFCVMLFPPLGPALYCLIVYSHSDVLVATDTRRAETHP
jgi:hypothetical protein